MAKFRVGDKVRVTFGGSDYCAYRDDPFPKDPKVGDVGVVTGFATSEMTGVHFNIVRLDSPFPVNSVGDNGWRLIDAWVELVEE